jgi:hypothetical protein
MPMGEGFSPDPALREAFSKPFRAGPRHRSDRLIGANSLTLRCRCLPMGRRCVAPAWRKHVERLPDSLAIAFWVVGSCWAMATVAYAFGVSPEWIAALVVFGIFSGIVEWIMRRKT